MRVEDGGGASIARKKILRAMIKPQGGTQGQTQPWQPNQGVGKGEGRYQGPIGGGGGKPLYSMAQKPIVPQNSMLYVLANALASGARQIKPALQAREQELGQMALNASNRIYNAASSYAPQVTSAMQALNPQPYIDATKRFLGAGSLGQRIGGALSYMAGSRPPMR